MPTLILAATIALAAAPAAPIRPPTAAESARVSRVVAHTWRYESSPLYQGLHARRRTLHPRVVRVRVSSADPRYALAAVALVDRNARRHGAPALVVVDGDYVLGGPSLRFAGACGADTPAAVRALVCPSP